MTAQRTRASRLSRPQPGRGDQGRRRGRSEPGGWRIAMARQRRWGRRGAAELRLLTVSHVPSGQSTRSSSAVIGRDRAAGPYMACKRSGGSNPQVHPIGAQVSCLARNSMSLPCCPLAVGGWRQHPQGDGQVLHRGVVLRWVLAAGWYPPDGAVHRLGGGRSTWRSSRSLWTSGTWTLGLGWSYQPRRMRPPMATTASTAHARTLAPFGQSVSHTSGHPSTIIERKTNSSK
jgi:hypothetical protein